MDFETALTAELKTIAALQGRVYPLASPEANAGKGVPYLIYVSSEGVRTRDLDHYRKGRVVEGELNIVTVRYSEMKAITRSVIDIIIGMERRVIGTDGPFIQEVKYDKAVELWEDGPKLYRCLIDFEMYFEGS